MLCSLSSFATIGTKSTRLTFCVHSLFGTLARILSVVAPPERGGRHERRGTRGAGVVHHRNCVSLGSPIGVDSCAQVPAYDRKVRSPESLNTTTTNGLVSRPFRDGNPMAQQIVSWFVSDGRFRVHAINAVGRRKGRIVEVEEVDTGERVYGSARKMQRLADTLRVSSGEFGHDGVWTPDTNP